MNRTDVACVNTEPDYLAGWAPRMAQQLRGSGEPDNAVRLEAYHAQHTTLLSRIEELEAAGQLLLNAYGEAHALYDLGDCEGSILMRALLPHPKTGDTK